MHPPYPSEGILASWAQYCFEQGEKIWICLGVTVMQYCEFSGYHWVAQFYLVYALSRFRKLEWQGGMGTLLLSFGGFAAASDGTRSTWSI